MFGTGTGTIRGIERGSPVDAPTRPPPLSAGKKERGKLSLFYSSFTTPPDPSEIKNVLSRKKNSHGKKSKFSLPHAAARSDALPRLRRGGAAPGPCARCI